MLQNTSLLPHYDKMFVSHISIFENKCVTNDSGKSVIELLV